LEIRTSSIRSTERDLCGEEVPMSHVSPQSLTANELQALLSVTADHPKDHLVFSLAPGTGLRLCELVGLNIGDLYSPTGQPRLRVRERPEVAKGG
jgi:integrase